MVEIAQRVQAVLVDALSVELDEVVPKAKLTVDLGAESIDFLDIVFRLEKEFEVKMPPGELFPENMLVDGKYVRDGSFTDVGIAELRKRMPFADFEDFVADPSLAKFNNVFTVQMICNYVESKLSGQPG